MTFWRITFLLICTALLLLAAWGNTGCIAPTPKNEATANNGGKAKSEQETITAGAAITSEKETEQEAGDNAIQVSDQSTSNTFSFINITKKLDLLALKEKHTREYVAMKEENTRKMVFQWIIYAVCGFIGYHKFDKVWDRHKDKLYRWIGAWFYKEARVAKAIADATEPRKKRN